MTARAPSDRSRGRAMLPGFVDATAMFMIGGLQALSANLLAAAGRRGERHPACRRRCASGCGQPERSSGQLIVGFGYDNAQLAELRHPTRDDLDAVSTDYPI
jgi:predicted amidohydrolase YtcJ